MSKASPLFPIQLDPADKERFVRYAKVKGFSSLSAFFRVAGNAMIILDEGNAANMEQAILKAIMLEKDMRKRKNKKND